MGTKTLHKDLQGNYTFTDTRTLEEAQQENLQGFRETTTSLILSAGYDEIWQRNASLGVIAEQEKQTGIAYIAACRNEYLRRKALILAATSNDEADAVQFVAPSVPENL